MKNVKLKIFTTIVSSFVIFGLFVQPIFAHIVVKPNQAGIATFQTFTIGVPNEKENPTVGLRLLIPAGLQHVSPNVKPGWTITKKQSGEGEDAKVTEIEWTGGSIPAGQRDDFLFSAQVPSEETTLQWKAYQTYQDGSVVSWDQNPNALTTMSDSQKEDMEKQGKGPYSQTKVINDLAESSDDHHTNSKQSASGDSQAFPISIAALLMAASALVLQLMKKK